MEGQRPLESRMAAEKESLGAAHQVRGQLKKGGVAKGAQKHARKGGFGLQKGQKSMLRKGCLRWKRPMEGKKHVLESRKGSLERIHMIEMSS